jgi:hypothetical protein
MIGSVNQTISKIDKTKGASIGYGKKDDLSIKSSINVPASNSYEIKSIFEKNIAEKKGMSMARRYYLVKESSKVRKKNSLILDPDYTNNIILISENIQ